jgi:hypothetical protein
MRLSSDLWVYALLRRVQLAGAFATVARKGDARGGAVLVKTINRKTGLTRLWAEAAAGDGETVWMRPTAGDAESEADAYIARAASVDPDLWVVEIEDADGRRFLTERVDGD